MPRPEVHEVSPRLLRRTSALSVCITALLCMWLFGNLYEAIVWNPQLIADPRPGSLVGEFAAGSPVYYYLPWTPVSLVLAVVLRARFGRDAPPRVRRAWNAALGCLALGVFTKVALITRVNPTFRDAAVPAEVVRGQAVLWAFGNGLVIAVVTVAVVLLTAWRRPSGP
ncbi:hypothetical protein Misp01_32300 [Microtetraspora sp. NBRC 13810]|uniref:hypothetical protein n=1 Tax=Microtetraspora sp. NBRC 13810 TaxID=3030990 RepID=UPI0024A0ACC8|nr:hypothetical protein [Microtetraspora sp. NBRC 13810]GLW08100.1 hypothetical protein Misp01_32300 [Microtetraspora sp. NBRC 13810]